MKKKKIKVENIDHCGIVAGIIDEIGLVEKIDEKVGSGHVQELVSAGIAVKAMIINGLGFVSAPLYLFAKFYEEKGTEHLLGKGIKAEHLNDDKLGRVLDKLYEAGITEIFVEIALETMERLGVKREKLHLDSTSFKVEGEYEKEEGEEVGIEIVEGYSRDKRPDLKQYMFQMICSGDGDIPLYIRVGSGNESDKKMFGEIIKEYRENWEVEGLWVADAELYNEENIEKLGETKWLSRVPSTIKGVKEIMESKAESEMKATEKEGYRICSERNNYGGVEQRWLVVESEKRKDSDKKEIEKKREAEEKKATAELKKLSKEKFACKVDAEKAGRELEKTWKYYEIEELEIEKKANYGGTGRPKKGEKASSYYYQVTGKIKEKHGVREKEEKRAGRFILATNVLSEEELSDEEMLLEYKNQQSAERGFRFLKDPLFFTSSVFLKTPKRIASLAMIMGLCLLVYSLGQRKLREALETTNKSVKNQLGKLTKTPTLRWIFQCFQSIHLLTIDGEQEITNLTKERKAILHLLGPFCQKYYLLL